MQVMNAENEQHEREVAIQRSQKQAQIESAAAIQALELQKESEQQKLELSNQSAAAKFRAEQQLATMDMEKKAAKAELEVGRLKAEAAAASKIIEARADAEAARQMAGAHAAERRAETAGVTPMEVMVHAYDALAHLGGTGTTILLGDWAHVPNFLFPKVPSMNSAFMLPYQPVAPPPAPQAMQLNNPGDNILSSTTKPSGTTLTDAARQVVLDEARQRGIVHGRGEYKTVPGLPIVSCKTSCAALSSSPRSSSRAARVSGRSIRRVPSLPRAHRSPIRSPRGSWRTSPSRRRHARARSTTPRRRQGRGPFRYSAETASTRGSAVRLDVAFAQGRVVLTTKVQAHVTLPLKNIDLPLDLRVEAEPVISAAYAVKLQSVDVHVTSSDTRLAFADKLAGVYTKVEEPITAKLKDFAYDLRPLLDEAYARVSAHRSADGGCARVRASQGSRRRGRAHGPRGRPREGPRARRRAVDHDALSRRARRRPSHASTALECRGAHVRAVHGDHPDRRALRRADARDDDGVHRRQALLLEGVSAGLPREAGDLRVRRARSSSSFT